ncbi:MAG: hypothetical protein LBT40_00010 [Deltaproteobacteria bacterium]|jgi:hypothetical protein|nr:hypothetical protein [Deltaproteobacteria bacterium]
MTTLVNDFYKKEFYGGVVTNRYEGAMPKDDGGPSSRMMGAMSKEEGGHVQG